MAGEDRLGPAADPQKQAKARKAEKLEAKQRDSDLRAVMGTPEGRRFVFRLLGDCGVYSCATVIRGGNPIDPYLTHLMDGRRAVGIEVQAEVARVSPQFWLQMQAERLSEEQRAERKSTRTEGDQDAGTD